MASLVCESSGRRNASLLNKYVGPTWQSRLAGQSVRRRRLADNDRLESRSHKAGCSSTGCDRLLQITPEFLFLLDADKQRLEVADTESAAAVALDDFVEQGRSVLNRGGEDLQ